MAIDEKSMKNGIVVMLDALGVRDYDFNSAKKFTEERDNIVKNLNDKGDDIKDKVFNLYHLVNKQMEIIPKVDKNTIFDDIGYEGVKVVTFGDTIILCMICRDKKMDRIMTLYAGEIVSQIISDGIKNGILWRGAMSSGEFYLDEKHGYTVLGPAVKDAVTWYERADWIGIITTPKLGLLVETMYKSKGDEGYGLFMKYNVDLKGDKKQKMWTLNWVSRLWKNDVNKTKQGDTDDFDSQWQVRNKLLQDMYRNKMPIPYGVEKKYDNTIEYVEYIITKYQENFEM